MPFAAIFAACVIPDLPWIARRLVEAADVSGDLVTTYAYFVAQASLVSCLLPTLAFAFLFTHYRRVAAFVFAGCLVHLLLDSLQDKWGNGVHVLAPFNWDMTSFNLVQVDSAITYVVTFAGLVPFMLLAKARVDAGMLCLNGRRMALCGVCILAYALLPLLFVGDVIASNSRYLQTFDDRDQRTGVSLELDRETLQRAGDVWLTTTHIGESLVVTNPDATFEDGGNYSLRAEFVEADSIRILEWRAQSRLRDYASYAGLLAIGCWMTIVLAWYRKLKRRPHTG